ncbi:PAS domain S-box protein [Thioflexithrix psekupsensis]|uniref:Sensor protein FixL n=1 Tax=Thioflexithrix psekupsensis TaxID=1570016 RepID=A0A251X865_9GAMM|nr:PAS domain S-box protein [Thioflexithrix psekupsensis]OUD14161.1 hypothetical protein TPSD3_07460 [Thioflexithrix psekupsensis]
MILKNNESVPRIVLGLQARMILFFGIMFAVTLLIINGVRIYGLPLLSIEGEYSQRQAEIFSHLNLITDLKEANLENWLEERMNNVEILSNSRMLRHTLFAIYSSNLEKLLEQHVADPTVSAIPSSLQQSLMYKTLSDDLLFFKSAYAAYDSIQLVDIKTGIVIVSTEWLEIGKILPHHLFEEIKTNVEQGHKIGVKHSKKISRNVPLDLFIAHYVYSLESEERLAILVINIKHQALTHILRADQVFGQSGEAFLLTKDFELLSATHKVNAPQVAENVPLLGKLSEQLQARIAQEQPAVLLGQDQYQQAVLAVYRPVPTGTGWGLVVKADEAEFFAPLRQSMLNAFAIGTILSIFLGLGGTFLLARALSRPLESLTQTIEHVQNGDLHARAHVTTRDEVGLLASMFNTMLAQLQQSRAELEQLVEARTAELRTANFSLEMTLDEMKDLNDDLAKEVNERKKAEATIRHKQREQELIFDAAPAFIWHKDTNNNILWMNRSAAELIGVNADQSAPYSLYELLNQAAADIAYQEDCEVITTRQPKLGITKRLYDKHQKLVWMQADKVPFIDEKGELTGVIVLATDITPRIQAEIALRENEKRFRTIIDTAVDGIIMIDTKGIIHLGNPSLVKMFGYDHIEELLNKNISILMPTPYSEQHDLYIENYLETGQRGIIGMGREIVGKRRDGSIFPIYLAVNELELEHRRMFTGIISDITELKRTQQDLQRSKRELERQNHAYSRFVPREFLSFLGKESIVDVELGDQVQKDMTIMFSDIRDFTALSESMTPEDNFRFINAYLSKMEPAIVQHQGFIDKYIGDAIMALFPHTADDAVKAAIGMLNNLHLYNAERQPKGYLPIEIGIGIHTGSLMLGTIGGRTRMDGTVISDAVNLASRVEALTKMYGASLLITEHTFNELNELDNYDIRIIDKVRVKGKSEPVIVFEILNGCSPEIREAKRSILELFTTGFTDYQRRNFTEAEEKFNECLRLNPKDKASQIYLKRCQFWGRYGDDPNWNGITELETKEG